MAADMTAGVCGVLAAFFLVWEHLRQDDHGPIRKWCRQKWGGLRKSAWPKLPEHSLAAFIRLMERVPSGLDNAFGYCVERLPGRNGPITLVGVLSVLSSLVGLEAAAVLWGPYVGLGAAVCALAAATVLSRVTDWRIACWLTGLVPSAAGAVLCIPVILTLPSSLLVVAALVLLPIQIAGVWNFLLLLLFVADAVMDAEDDELGEAVHAPALVLTLVAAEASVVTTLMALVVGHLCRPSLYVPQTLQMVCANAVCDACTMLATFLLVKWMLVRPNLLRIPAGIAVDIIVGALLAFASLYFGLVGSSEALSPREVLWVLVGKSPDGKSFELGPYFWAMHTTFIPTMVYMAMLLCAWFSKAVLTPIVWFFGKAAVDKSPLKLTALVLSFLAITCVFCGKGLKAAEDAAKGAGKGPSADVRVQTKAR